jgi:hypothetical protein
MDHEIREVLSFRHLQIKIVTNGSVFCICSLFNDTFAVTRNI